MFKKAFTSKTSAPLRSSDARKTREEVARAFDISSSLAKELLPDGFLTMKASTHLDEPVRIYMAPNGNALFFRLGVDEGGLVPTCYVFDLLPDLLPVLVTAPAVVANLVSGAALFSKGVSDQSLAHLPEDIHEGSLVAIRASGSAQIVAVGSLAASRSELISDRTGKAVHTLHARGDYLWESGNGVVSEPLSSARTSRHKSSKAAAEAEENDLAGALETTSISSESAAQPPSSNATAPSTDFSPADVDTILRNALLLAISSKLGKDSTAFPMPASSLYSTYILPYRPAGTPPKADIKASGYKKLTAMMKQANKSGVLTTKEVKGELLVMSVNGEHADVQNVRPYKTLSQASSQAAAAASTADSSNGGAVASSSASTLDVKELYKASSAVLPIFQGVEHTRPPQDLYVHYELKQLILDYAKSHSLVHPRDQKFLMLDETLSCALLKKGESVDVLAKDEALKRLKDSCQSFWSLQRPGEDKIVKKGSPPTIKVNIKNVGKRQVTLVSGHEAWDLFTSEELAEELKHRSASSTAVQPLAGSAKKGQTPRVEIMCQGTHDALVSKLLIARGVPKAYIDVDTTKSKR